MADQVTWEKDIQDLFTQLDVGCMRARGTVDLSSYQSVKDRFQGILDRVDDGRMPKGGPQWSKDKVELLKKWRDDGFLER
jgi:hypothetical protein